MADLGVPKPLPLVGHLLSLARDPLGFLERCRATGPVVELRLRKRTFLLNDPSDIHHVLVENAANYHKGDGVDVGTLLYGNGLLSSEGDVHRRQRRLLQPIFSREQLGNFLPIIQRHTIRLIDGWRVGHEFDAAAAMMRLSLAIAGDLLFGIDLGNRSEAVGQAFETCQDYILKQAFAVVRFPSWLPTPDQSRYRRALNILDETVLGLIRQRRAEANCRRDLLTLLIEADDGSDQLDDREVRDQALTMLLGGHEPIAVGLTWTLYLLARHPEAQTRVRSEVEKTSAEEMTVSSVSQCTRTKAAFAESLRLYPPPWIMTRKAMNNDVLPSGAPIPAGVGVYVSPYLLHRDARFFPDPLAFRPERFEATEDDPRLKQGYFPFGAGPRGCIGEALSWVQGVTILATILSRIRLELVSPQEIPPEPLITLRPRGEVRLRVSVVA